MQTTSVLADMTAKLGGKSQVLGAVQRIEVPANGLHQEHTLPNRNQNPKTIATNVPENKQNNGTRFVISGTAAAMRPTTTTQQRQLVPQTHKIMLFD